MVVGGTLGLVAGYMGKTTSQVIMRLADVIMSFPSLLIAVVVLYVLGASIPNMILVLGHHPHSHLPAHHPARGAGSARAHVRAGGHCHGRASLAHHSEAHPAVVAPTLVTIATLDFAFVMLAESSLSFLGIACSHPRSPGADVSHGRPYLTSAWWLPLWPG